MHTVPNGLVGNLTVVQTMSTSVKINWTLPMLDNRGGVILKYMVTYQRVLQAGVSSVSSIQSNSTTMTEYMATGLTTGSQYMLTVSACTSAGCGPIENITANTSDNGRIACIKFLLLVFAYATCANACACSCPHPVSVHISRYRPLCLATFTQYWPPSLDKVHAPGTGGLVRSISVHVVNMLLTPHLDSTVLTTCPHDCTLRAFYRMIFPPLCQ